jgi:hypothetical protein
MRGLILAFVFDLALSASAQAAPLAPSPAPSELGAAPPIELVDHACGWGWHRIHWQDHWGYWHWHCVPIAHVYHYGRKARTSLCGLARSQRRLG